MTSREAIPISFKGRQDRQGEHVRRELAIAQEGAGPCGEGQCL